MFKTQFFSKILLKFLTISRSLDGNGSFNYRMVFPFEFLPIDKKIVIKEKVSVRCIINESAMLVQILSGMVTVVKRI